MRLSALLCCLLAALVACHDRSFHQVSVANPEFHPNEIFLAVESTSSPKFSALKAKYQLDTIFHGEKDEFARILLIRNWIKQHIRIDDIGPYPGNSSAESILDEALKGHGFHCGHFMVVQNAIMNSYGYVTRCLGAGPGVKGIADGHHGMNEVWLNKYHKWFLCDGKYNSHFEKNGIPLSALEIRDEYLKNRAADIVLVKGLSRKPIDHDDEVNKDKEFFVRTYTWIEWNRNNDKYTNWPVDSSYMIMYGDDYFKHHTWIWDGKPHWAYNTPHMTVISNRNDIEWTPNTIHSSVSVKGDSALIRLESNTPNLKTYQMKQSGSEWVDISPSVALHLQNKANEVLFRPVNMEGVPGVEHRVLIAPM